MRDFIDQVEGELPGTVVCYLDNTVGLPLLASYALARRRPRPLKRLYDRRADLMAALLAAYQEARAERGSRQKFERVLRKVSDREPVEGDER